MTSHNFSERFKQRVKLSHFFLGLLAAVALVFFLQQAKEVILPFLLAWLLSLLLEPLVARFGGRKWTRILTIALIVLCFMIGLYFIVIFLSASTSAFFRHVPDLKEKFVLMLTQWADVFSNKFPILPEGTLEKEIHEGLAESFDVFFKYLRLLVEHLTALLMNFILVLIILAFILYMRPYSKAKIRLAFNEGWAAKLHALLTTLTDKMSHYLFVLFLLSFGIGMSVWLICSLAGVKAALTWGLIAFFLHFIPAIGSILAAIPPVLLAFLQFYPDPGPGILVAVSIFAVNQLIGNLLGPKVFGNKLDLSPVVILASLLFWAWVWGIIGALLSVVILFMLKLTFEQFEFLKPVAVLMSSGKKIGSDKKKIENRQ